MTDDDPTFGRGPSKNVSAPCPVTCGNLRRPDYAVCWPCWQTVPRDLQRNVTQLWRLRQRALEDLRNDFRSRDDYLRVAGRHQTARDAVVAAAQAATGFN